jgi:hypothetical protein
MTRARILADYVSGGTTAAEFDYLDGVTSNVQTQMDLKAPLASPTFTGTVGGIPATTAATLGAGVLPVGITGGSGLTALGTVASGNLSNTAIVYPTGHVVGTAGGSDHTARVIASPDTVACEAVSLAYTSTVANSNFIISGNYSVYSTGGHFATGIFLNGLTNPTNLLWTASHADTSGTGNQGWYGWYIGGPTNANPRINPTITYFYDAGTHSVGTTFTFKLGAMGYYGNGQVGTNVNDVLDGGSTIIIQEIAP